MLDNVNNHIGNIFKGRSNNCISIFIGFSIMGYVRDFTKLKFIPKNPSSELKIKIKIKVPRMPIFLELHVLLAESFTYSISYRAGFLIMPGQNN